MSNGHASLNKKHTDQLRELVASTGVVKSAQKLDIARQTLASLLAGLPVHRTTLRAVAARLAELEQRSTDPTT